MTSHATPPQPRAYASLAAALIDLAGTDSARRLSASFALCCGEPRPAEAIRQALHELGASSQPLVPGLVCTVTTERDCLPVEVAGMALGLQGEDGQTELIALMSHDSFLVRFAACLGFECAGPRARWAVPTLIRRLHTERAPMNGDVILRALGTIGGPEAIACLNAVGWNRRVFEEGRCKAAGALREAMGSLPVIRTARGDSA